MEPPSSHKSDGALEDHPAFGSLMCLPVLFRCIGFRSLVEEVKVFTRQKLLSGDGDEERGAVNFGRCFIANGPTAGCISPEHGAFSGGCWGVEKCPEPSRHQQRASPTHVRCSREFVVLVLREDLRLLLLT